MTQPELLDALYIPKLLSLSLRYLVTQTYQRGLRVADSFEPTAILVTPYDDGNKANIHLRTIAEDRLRSVLDLHDANHRQLILDMIEGSRFIVYWPSASGLPAD